MTSTPTETSTESVLTEVVLRRSPLLAACSGSEIETVLSTSAEQRLDAGEVLFDEREPVDAVWILADGALEITKHLNGDELIQREEPGAFIGEIPVLTHERSYVRASALTASRLVRIPEPTFRSLMASCPTVAATVVRTLVERVRRYQTMLQERDRMAGLGTIAAGLAHELNNPATAVNRAVTQAEDALGALQTLVKQPASLNHLQAVFGIVAALHSDPDRTERARAEAAALDPVARSDREDAVVAWLTAHGAKDAWECAAGMVEAGLTPERLDEAAGDVDADVLRTALTWAERFGTLRELLAEVKQSTGRITELVAAIKGYSHADRVTPKTVDVHVAIENTLTMMGYKLRGANVAVEREYDRSLPKIRTFGGELHQVWTNLIDNAIDAIAADPKREKPGGTIRVRTSRDGRCAQVDIIDTGPGIPPDAVPRLFDAFFTTKEAGKGTGLGLDIVRRIVTRHEGTVSVSPEPGATRFTVRLPLALEGATS